MAKKTESAPKAKKSRKEYLVGVKAGGGFDITKQPESVRKYVSAYRADKKSGFGLHTYGDVERDAIKAERAKRAKMPGLPDGHTMTAAKNRLYKGWKKSIDPKGATMKKAAKSWVKKGASATASKKMARDNHVVKFGVDPYHK